MPSFITLAVMGPTVAVVAAIGAVLWHERTSTRTTQAAVISAVVLAAWMAVTTVLAWRGRFVPVDPQSVPPVASALIITLAGLTIALAASSSLRSLLSNQQNLVRLNAWRLEGAVFLILMWQGRVPALWALPAGIGDVIVGVAAFWIASQVDTPRGPTRAIVFNVFGMIDLVVAVGLGVMTNPGPAQVFPTTPTAELLTQFPLVMVPTFLVPLAFVLHVVSLWQLIGGTWAPVARAHPAAASMKGGSLSGRPVIASPSRSVIDRLRSRE